MRKSLPVRIVKFIILIGLMSLSLKELMDNILIADYLFIFALVITLIAYLIDEDILKIFGE